MKLSDNRSIDKLEQSLKAINNKFSVNKSAKELIIEVEETLTKMRDNDFIDEANYCIGFKDKELVLIEADI